MVVLQLLLPDHAMFDKYLKYYYSEGVYVYYLFY